MDDESQDIGMIETALPGSSLDAFKGQSTLRSIARAAANVHRTAVGEFDHLASSVDRAQHVKARLAWREHQKPYASGHGPDFYENQLRSLYRRTAR